MRYANLLSLPYIPNRDKKQKSNPHISPYELRHRIAYTETVRGVDDDVPALLFFGAPFALLRDTCLQVHKMMAGKVHDLTIMPEHSCRRKNGKCYWRWVVSVVRLDERFISLREFTSLLISCMQRIGNCKVRHYRLETFINL